MQASVTLTNQSVSAKILWLTPHAMTPLSACILFANYSKFQLSIGVTNSSGILLLQTFDSIFAHFITSIQYIIILHEKFNRALHKEIIHDHRLKKLHGMIVYIEIIHNTDHKIWYFDYWIYYNFFDLMQCLQFD